MAFGGDRTVHRMTTAIENAGFEIRRLFVWIYSQGMVADSQNVIVKPALEPIILARKPLIGTVAENIARYGTGALRIDACRIAITGKSMSAINSGRTKYGTQRVFGNGIRSTDNFLWQPSNSGRYPSNVIIDGSEAVLAEFPYNKSTGGRKNASKRAGIYGAFAGDEPDRFGYNDEGSAARFFYHAKASKADRAGTRHPTVKPIDLIAYLQRLVTPPGGVTLDPFAGSGTSIVAARREGLQIVAIEKDPWYFMDCKRRVP